MKPLSLIVFLGIIFRLSIIQAQIVYVTPAGSGLKDGTSWTNALAGNDSAASGYTRLADTLRHALSGAEFWVAEGTYLPCWDNDRNKSFEIRENIRIYGGFSGIELSLQNRNWEAHPSRFSGNIGLGNLNSDNSYHVFLTSGPYWTNHSFLDGLIICDGYAQDPSLPSNSGHRYGGGIYSSHKLTIRNSVFSDNSSYNGGGAIFAKDYAMNWWMVNEIILENCDFRNNSLLTNNYGGSVYITRDYVSMTTSIRNCRFVNNSGWHGSAVYARGNCNLQNSLVANNSANYGALVIEYGTMTITNSTIVNNAGGGIRIKTSGILNIHNSIVWGGGTITGMSGYTYTANSCCIEGGATGLNIVDEDPLFAAPTAGLGTGFNGSTANWNLRWCSPCFNTGDTLLHPSGILNDLAGQTRIRYSSVDMGAYELDTTGLIPNAVGFQNNRIYVSDTSIYIGNGTSWQTALAGNAESCRYPGQTLLYEAMKDAEPGTEIWVTSGLYKCSLTHNRDHAFTLGSGVRVMGGFQGTESQPEERNQTSQQSVFTGEFGDPQLLTDNAYHVFNIMPQGSVFPDTAILDKISIEKGYADGSNQKGEGAGLLINSGVKLRLNEVFVSQNVSKGNGAGIRILGNAHVDGRSSSISGNRVIKYYSSPTQNYSANGAGFFNSGDLRLTNCLVRYNDSATMGGGIYSEDSLILSHCIIDSNYTVTTNSKGGGLVNSGYALIQNSSVSANIAQIQAGGILNISGAILVLDSCMIQANRILHNTSYGGGIYNQGTVTIRGSDFIQNESKSDGGGFYNASSASTTISESRFYKNNASGNSTMAGGGGIFNAGILNINRSYLCNNTTSGSGGGIYNPTRVSNCLIANNTKGGTFSTGGGIKVSNGCQGIFHSTIVNNNGQGIAATTVSGQTMQEIPIQDTTLLVNSIIFGNSLQVTGNFNKSYCLIQNIHTGGSLYFDNPVFLSPSLGPGPDLDGLNANWNLSACSPALDRANSDFITSADSLDLNGMMRILGSAADLGAFEFQGTPQVFSYGQPVVYVNEDTIPGGTGTSWNDPIHGNAPSCRYPGYTNLYEVFRDIPDTGEVWIKTGVYKTSHDNDRNKSFLIQEGLRVYGGFSGNETNKELRNIAENPTILSGNINSETDSTDNAYHVFYSYPQMDLWDNPAIFDGITIQDGSAIYSCGYCLHDNIIGGGLFINSNCVVELYNCLVTKNSGLGNYTTNPLQIGRLGGSGIYNKGRLKMKNSTVSLNTNNEMGGGIFNESVLEMKLCKVDNNRVYYTGSQYYLLWGGAGIYNYITGILTIDSCEITDNVINIPHLSGGGIRNRGQMSLTNSIFTGNNNVTVSSDPDVSALNCTFSNNDGGIGTSGSLIARNCLFTHNTGAGTGSGGTTLIDSCEFSYNEYGIQTYGKAIITNSKIHHNNNSGFIINPQTGWFGIIVVVTTKIGAGIRHQGDSLLVENCEIHDNIAAGGSGVCLVSGYGKIKQSSLFYNMADAGAAIKNYDHIDIDNCLITNNSSNRYGIFCNIGNSITNITSSTIARNSINTGWNIDGVFFHGVHQEDTGTSTYTIKNSILDINNYPLFATYPGNYGNDSIHSSLISSGYPGIGNISGDPLFVNPVVGYDTIFTPLAGGFRLHPCSPCINAGSDSLVADSLDLDGNTRIVEQVDMGAYEYPVVETGHRIFGTIQYDNEDTTAIDSVWVILHNQTMAIDSFQTRAPGEYCFSNVQPGEYTIECRSLRTSGGSSSIDAFLILKHFTQFNFLTGLRLLAASTDTYPWINAIDALMTHRRYTGAISQFTASEWIFEPKTVLMTNDNLNIPIRAICRGDVDGSFEP